MRSTLVIVSSLGEVDSESLPISTQLLIVHLRSTAAELTNQRELSVPSTAPK
jgi:hypothetical protein